MSERGKEHNIEGPLMLQKQHIPIKIALIENELIGAGVGSLGTGGGRLGTGEGSLGTGGGSLGNGGSSRPIRLSTTCLIPNPSTTI